MKICSFEANGSIHQGFLEGEELVDADSMGESFLREAMRSPKEARDSLEGAPRYPFAYSALRRPFIPNEIWGAGITYLRSRDAREQETESKGIYDKVYSATRPEIFFKDTGLRTVGPGEAICVRSDSTWTVPEPELTIVLDDGGGVLGYTIGNDVSARDIEGANPLYLPQSKIFRSSCSIGPVVTTRDEVGSPNDLKIQMKILKDKEVLFEGKVETSRLKRSFDELVAYLRRDNILSGWTALMTGTGVVPPDDFSLKGGETVEIEIQKIGLLRNPVVKLGSGPA